MSHIICTCCWRAADIYVSERLSRITSLYLEFCPSSQRFAVSEKLQPSIEMDVDDVFRSPVPASLTDFSQLRNPLLLSFLLDAPPLEATPFPVKPSTPNILHVELPRAPSLYEKSLLEVVSSPLLPSEFAESPPFFDRSINRSTTDEAISACSPSLSSTRSYASVFSNWSSSCSLQSFLQQSSTYDGPSSSPSMLHGLFSPLRPTYSQGLDC